jgi:group I intron endonuclease
MSEKGYIYKIKNIVNNKEYVGCTITSLKKRFEEHAWRCLKTDINTKFCNSVRKYGVENFKIDLIEECDVANIYEREKHYIKEYNTYNIGLNSTYGGEGCLGYKHSKEIREKISKNLKDGRSHKGKTYEELYGDKANEEKEKRKLSVKNGWDSMSDEEKEKRVNNIKNVLLKNSKYGVDLIKEIKNKFKEGYKIKELKLLYPNVKENFFYDVKNGRRWVDL